MWDQLWAELQLKDPGIPSVLSQRPSVKRLAPLHCVIRATSASSGRHQHHVPPDGQK